MQGLASAVVLLASIAASAPEAAIEQLDRSPFLGEWIANLSRSAKPAGFIQEGSTLRFSVNGDSMVLTLATAGQTQDVTQTFHVDGKEHPTGSGDLMTVSRLRGPRSLDVSMRFRGEEVGQAIFEVSPDDGTLTIAVFSMFPRSAWEPDTLPSPPVAESMAAFDRQ